MNKVRDSSEVHQFLSDYWLELKRYDLIISLFTAWGIFAAPPGFLARKRFRLILFVTQAFLAIGLTVQLSCTRDDIPEAVAVIMTLLLITIPIEILNVLWFRVVKSDDELKTKSAKANACGNCCLWTIQYLGKAFGILMSLVVFAYGAVFFVLTFVGIHPGCSEHHRYVLAAHVVLFQFLLVPLLMCLPYWRDQSVVLSFLGELGPVIGILMHFSKYGFHPPPPAAVVVEPTKDIENPVVKDLKIFS